MRNENLLEEIASGKEVYFENTFEVAIFDVESRDFITRFFYPETTDDVIGWMSSEEVEKLVNSVIKREDLSIEV